MTKRSMVLGLAGLGLAGLGQVAGAHAEDAGLLGPDVTLSGTVALQSDYRFRGISQNARQATPEASLIVQGPSGWYGSVWAAKTNWGLPRQDGATPSYEVDEYVGKHTDLWGTDLNVEAYYYSYPDYHGPKDGAKASFFEAIGQLTHNFGDLSLTGSWAYSPALSLGNGTGNDLSGTAAYTLNDWVTLSADLGHQWAQNAKYGGVGHGYTHYDAGATVTYHAVSLDLRYAGTDLGARACAFYMGNADDHPCAGGFTATLSYAIGAPS